MLVLASLDAGKHILTFSNGERRVGEVETHQLSWQLIKKVAGSSAI